MIYMTNNIKLECGDWEELVKDVPDKSIDLVFCDLPYASKTFGRCVATKWDTPIDLDKLWVEIKRIRRDDHVPIFMCCNMKFAVDLINSNKKEFRYDLIWVKSAPCSFLSARKMPMKKHELVLVFYKHLPFYDLSSHTHKFLGNKKSVRDKNSCYGELKGEVNSKYNPPLPTSILEKTEQDGIYGTLPTSDKLADTQGMKRSDKHKAQYDPPLPTSVLEDEREMKEINTLYNGKMKRPIGKTREPTYDPPLPTSVLEQPNQTINKLDNETINKLKDMAINMEMEIEEVVEDISDVDTNLNIEMPVKQKVVKDIVLKDTYDFTGRLKNGKLIRTNIRWDPPLPTSVIENTGMIKDGQIYNGGKAMPTPYTSQERKTNVYDPPLPTSVVEKKPYFHKESSILPTSIMSSTDYNGGKMFYEPPLPTSVLESEFQDIVLDPPDTLLRIKSQKGKHATQKPTDLMKWVLKYYSKEGDMVFDPTCGSGSTGVACIEMNRGFIGFERDKEIFEVAKQRLFVDKK